MTWKPWDCPACGKPFLTSLATERHIADAHPRRRDVYARQRKKPPHKRDWEEGLADPDGEESLADIAVAAQLKRDMGESLDPLEESLLP